MSSVKTTATPGGTIIRSISCNAAFPLARLIVTSTGSSESRIAISSSTPSRTSVGMPRGAAASGFCALTTSLPAGPVSDPASKSLDHASTESARHQSGIASGLVVNGQYTRSGLPASSLASMRPCLSTWDRSARTCGMRSLPALASSSSKPFLRPYDSKKSATRPKVARWSFPPISGASQLGSPRMADSSKCDSRSATSQSQSLSSTRHAVRLSR